MDILILGGTAMLGYAVARLAHADGHAVTCFARGTSNPPPGVPLVRGDRDDDDGLRPLATRTWDAVIDVARHPGQVRRATRDLRATHWVYVSSASVYALFDRPGQDESAPTLPPLSTDVMADLSEYGPAKVACENVIREQADSSTIVRAGLIGGYGDWSGRSGYYPWRFAHPTGPDVLVPPDVTFPTSLIDVEDLAQWLLTCATEQIRGTFNASGPIHELGEVLAASRAVAQSEAEIRPVPQLLLEKAGVSAWMGPASLPLWVDDPAWRHFATMDTCAAREHGLAARALPETLAAALDYERHRQGPRHAGLTDEEERAVRALL